MFALAELCLATDVTQCLSAYLNACLRLLGGREGRAQRIAWSHFPASNSDGVCKAVKCLVEKGRVKPSTSFLRGVGVESRPDACMPLALLCRLRKADCDGLTVMCLLLQPDFRQRPARWSTSKCKQTPSQHQSTPPQHLRTSPTNRQAFVD